jgi:hypothetical protein
MPKLQKFVNILGKIVCLYIIYDANKHPQVKTVVLNMKIDNNEHIRSVVIF